MTDKELNTGEPVAQIVKNGSVVTPIYEDASPVYPEDKYPERIPRSFKPMTDISRLAIGTNLYSQDYVNQLLREIEGLNAKLNKADALLEALKLFVPNNVFKEDGIWLKGDKDGVACQVDDRVAKALSAIAKANGAKE